MNTETAEPESKRHPEGPDTFPLTKAERRLIKRLNKDTKTYDHHWLISQLKEYLGIAAQVELATIPIYLYTYYSINRRPQAYKSEMDPPKSWGDPPKSTAPAATPKTPVPPSPPTPYLPKDVHQDRVKQIQIYANESAASIMSVAVEEMLHMSLASNVLYALGGYPELYGKSPWPYPANLPGHNYFFRPYYDKPDSDWHDWAEPMKLSLGPLSYDHLWQFLEIEWPENPGDMSETANFDTIGQVYSYIRCLISADLVTCKDFQNGAATRQIQPGYYSANNIDTIYAKGSFDKSAPAPPPVEPITGDETLPEMEETMEEDIEMAENWKKTEAEEKKVQTEKGYDYPNAAAAASYDDAPDSHAGVVELLTIDTKKKALQAIATICDQGEGANLHRIEATDDVSHLEESHYYKFVSIQAHLQKPEACDDMPPLIGPPPPLVRDPISEEELKYFVFPYPKNPTRELYAYDPVKVKIVDACNGLYQYMLLLTEAIFKAEGRAQKGLFYKGMHNSMIWILDKLLQAMREVPVPEGEKFALAPTFENISLGNDPYGELKKLAREADDAIITSGGNYSDVSGYMKLIYDPPSSKPALPDVRDSSTWDFKAG